MGDADTQHLDGETDAEQVAGMLDALDDDLFILHNTIHLLQQRTQDAVTAQEKSYENFRQFFIGLNVIVIPLVMAAGFYYGLTEFFPSEMSQTVLRSLITLLLALSGGIGVPLYVGALLAIYKFRVPISVLPEEMIRDIVAELIDETPVDSETRSISSELIEDSLELMGVSDNHSNEGLEAKTRTRETQGTENSKSDPVVEICDLLMINEEDIEKHLDDESKKLTPDECSECSSFESNETSNESNEPPKAPKRWWMLEKTSSLTH